MAHICTNSGYAVNAVGGTNGSPWWWFLWGGLCRCSTEFSYYSYCRKPMRGKFFVPARTILVVKQVIAPSYPRRALSDVSVQGIGARGPFWWLLLLSAGGSGTILWGAIFVSEASPRNACLKNKNRRAHNPARKKSHPKTPKRFRYLLFVNDFLSVVRQK